jgi:hypothetical protein
MTDKLVFFDKVGEHISQKGDCNTGGQNFMVAKDMRAHIGNSFKDNHFTIFGFTAADGRPIMWSVIIASSKLKLTVVTGSNPLSKDAEDVSSNGMKVLDDETEAMKDEHSNGVDHMFQFRSTCTFNGSDVPPFVTCSKNGSITSQLFTNMLSTMDDLEIFDRSDGVTPPYAMGMGVDSKSLSWIYFRVKHALGVLYWRTIWYIHVASWR